MRTKGTINQQIAKLERSIRKFGNTYLKRDALKELIEIRSKK